MLTFEELAILLVLVDNFRTRGDIAFWAVKLYPSNRFDERVALAIIDRQIGLGLISKGHNNKLCITNDGLGAIAETKNGSKKLLNKLFYG